jgi:hypothetical protein
MKKLLYFFLLTPFSLAAQTNESDSLKLKASLALTGFWQSGNVHTLIFRAKADVTYKPWKQWVFNTKNSYLYQEFGKEKADEDILSLNFLNFAPERKLSPLLLGIVTSNFRREIDLRYLIGGGLTYQILKKDDSWLKFSLSSEYEQTNFTEDNFNLPEYDGNRSINTIRSTIWVSGKYYLFDKKLIMSHENYFQPSLENSDNFRWQADIGLELPISKFLNFKINYLHTFESIVIEGQNREDTFLTFGVTLKNY